MMLRSTRLNRRRNRRSVRTVPLPRNVADHSPIELLTARAVLDRLDAMHEDDPDEARFTDEYQDQRDWFDFLTQ